MLDREPQLVQPYLDRAGQRTGTPVRRPQFGVPRRRRLHVRPGGRRARGAHPRRVPLRARGPSRRRPSARARGAGRKSQAAIVESYGGPADAVYLTNAVTEVAVEDGAVLQDREGEQAFHTALLRVRQGRQSTFSSMSLALGAALARHDQGKDGVPRGRQGRPVAGRVPDPAGQGELRGRQRVPRR